MRVPHIVCCWCGCVWLLLGSTTLAFEPGSPASFEDGTAMRTQGSSYGCSGYGCQGSRHNIHYWELLMLDPRGADRAAGLGPQCVPLGRTCVPGQGTCCAGSCQPTSDNGGVLGTAPFTCCDKIPLHGPCTTCGVNSNCCVGYCDGSCTYSPINIKAQRTIGSLSGATLVVVREGPSPVRLSELTTGQHVPCLGDLADLSLTQTTRWCQVKNYVNANKQDLQQFEITASQPGAGAVKLVANGHMMITVLEEKGGHVKATSPPALTTSGAYKTIRVVDTREGDRLLMKADPADAASGFVLATVTNFKVLKRGGYYKPAIDAPYMIAGGFVVAMYDRPGGITRTTSPEVIAAATLAQHQLLAPLYTQHLQHLGTPARLATWAGEPSWPQWQAMRTHIKHLVKDSNTTALAGIHAWFKPRHEAWVARAAAVSTDDMVLPKDAADLKDDTSNDRKQC